MAELRYDEVQVGTALPPLQIDAISRLTLALYCGASGDHNPLHVDSDFARAAGLGDDGSVKISLVREIGGQRS